MASPISAGRSAVHGATRGLPPAALVAAAVGVVVVAVGIFVLVGRGNGGSSTASASAPSGSGGGAPAAAGERSVDAYCASLDADLGRIIEDIEDAGHRAGSGSSDDLEDVVAGLLDFGGDLIALPSELSLAFERAEGVAPPEIEADTRALKEGFAKQADSIGSDTSAVIDDPLSGFVGALVDGIVMSHEMKGPLERVDAFLVEHCTVSLL